MIIMNMQNKLYTIQFFSPSNNQFIDGPWATIEEPQNHEFRKKVQTPG